MISYNLTLFHKECEFKIHSTRQRIVKYRYNLQLIPENILYNLIIRDYEFNQFRSQFSRGKNLLIAY